MGRLLFPAALTAALALACSSQPLDESEGGSEGGGLVHPGGEEGSGELTEPLYPEGPYGTSVGATIANLRFLGWRDPIAVDYDPERLELIELADYYTPEPGVGDVRMIAMNVGAVWCTVCRLEYRQLRDETVYERYRPMGVEILGVLFEDNDARPAQPSDLQLWGSSTGYSVPFPLVLDPGFKTGVYFDSDAVPLNMLIDASNMEILAITMGYDSQNPDAYWGGIEAWLASR